MMMMAMTMLRFTILAGCGAVERWLGGASSGGWSGRRGGGGAGGGGGVGLWKGRSSWRCGGEEGCVRAEARRGTGGRAGEGVCGRVVGVEDGRVAEVVVVERRGVLGG